ncbi:MAG: xanthine/uracil permease [Clostridiales Family XIII bacterium]|jgi:AGZA family xanthine/uracil permease-like MFS transporter|nr:xanthine/uracil permease [Clostridiales Family XIII bacterium]
MFALLLAVIFVVINGVTQMYMARGFGYKLKPTGLAYLVGAAGNLISGSVVPISGQAETLTLSGLIKNMGERVAALLIAAAVGIFLGATGSVSWIVSIAGDSAVNGMMAGVGYILAMVGITMCKEERRVGLISMFSAFAIYIVSHDLVYTIAGSVLLSSLDFAILQGRRVDLNEIAKNAGSEPESEEWRFWRKEYWADFKILKPKFGLPAFFAGLSFICLNIGSNISFGNITSSIAGQTPKLDALSFINSLADIPSILFGGAPIEAIISGTAAVPDVGGINGAWLAGILMMLVSGILLLLGVIGKLGKYIPAQSIAGFLFIIGFNVTLVPDLKLAFASGDPVAAAVAAGVTIISKNAFYGLAAGTLIYQLPQLVQILLPLAM